MLDETFHPTQTLSQREELAAFEKTATIVQAAAQLRADDSAEATVHLALCQLMMRMACKPWVVHALDLRMLLQKPRDREGIGAMPLHSQCKRLDATQDQKAIKGAGNVAERVLHEAQPIGQLAVANDHCATERVGVPIQELGYGMHHDIDAVIERALAVWRGECVVADCEQATPLGYLRDRREVRQLQ